MIADSPLACAAWAFCWIIVPLQVTAVMACTLHRRSPFHAAWRYYFPRADAATTLAAFTIHVVAGRAAAASPSTAGGDALPTYAYPTLRMDFLPGTVAILYRVAIARLIMTAENAQRLVIRLPLKAVDEQSLAGLAGYRTPDAPVGTPAAEARRGHAGSGSASDGFTADEMATLDWSGSEVPPPRVLGVVTRPAAGVRVE